MSRQFLPAGPRSATAVSGVTDKRDENLYSAGLLQNTALGQLSLFTTPKGQPIPFLRGTSAASANGWQGVQNDATTNFEKAGELGDGIGDAAVRGITLHVEEAGIDTLGAYTAYGASQLELADMNRKMSFELRVSKKPMFKSPFWAFPSVGGVIASQQTILAAPSSRTTATNGRPGAIRRLITHIMVSRRDTLEGVLQVNGGTGLLFRAAAADGIPCLVWSLLPASIRGDAR
jgi:hypothetical protein